MKRNPRELLTNPFPVLSSTCAAAGDNNKNNPLSVAKDGVRNGALVDYGLRRDDGERVKNTLENARLLRPGANKFLPRETASEIDE